MEIHKETVRTAVWFAIAVITAAALILISLYLMSPRVEIHSGWPF